MKIVGFRHRDEFEPDPAEAWRRGRELDRMLHMAMPPRRHGVWRLTHEQMNQADLTRQREQAAKVDRPD